MSAPEWDQGYGLSWSGRWHKITGAARNWRGDWVAPTTCGVDVYLKDAERWFSDRLEKIASGEKFAPICKRCAKAKAAQ